MPLDRRHIYLAYRLRAQPADMMTARLTAELPRPPMGLQPPVPAARDMMRDDAIYADDAYRRRYRRLRHDIGISFCV